MTEDYAELVRMLRSDSNVARPYRVVAADAITALFAERDALREALTSLVNAEKQFQDALACVPGDPNDHAEFVAAQANQELALRAARSLLNQGGSND